MNDHLNRDNQTNKNLDHMFQRGRLIDPDDSNVDRTPSANSVQSSIIDCC